MKKFTLIKNSESVSWKVGRVQGAFSILQMDVFGTEVIVELTEGYTTDSDRIVAKEAWLHMKAEDLDALANAALCMADTLRNPGGAS